MSEPEEEFKLEVLDEHKEDPETIFKELQESKLIIETEYLKTGGNLFTVFNLKLYEKKGYQTFGDFVWNELGIREDKANGLRRLWKMFVKNLGLSHTDLIGIGYSKAQALVPVINTKNAKLWLEKAKNSKLKELRSAISEEKSKYPKYKIVEHADLAQAEKAVAQIGVSSQLETTNTLPENPATDIAKEEQQPTVKRTIFLRPDQNRFYEAALEEVERQTKSSSESFNLTCALSEFLSSRIANSKKTNKADIFMSMFQARFGGRLFWIKTEKQALALKELVDKNPHLFEGVITNDTTE